MDTHYLVSVFNVTFRKIYDFRLTRLARLARLASEANWRSGLRSGLRSGPLVQAMVLARQARLAAKRVSPPAGGFFEVTGLWEKGLGRKWVRSAHFLPSQINPRALSFRCRTCGRRNLSMPHVRQ